MAVGIFQSKPRTVSCWGHNRLPSQRVTNPFSRDTWLCPNCAVERFNAVNIQFRSPPELAAAEVPYEPPS